MKKGLAALFLTAVAGGLGLGYMLGGESENHDPMACKRVGYRTDCPGVAGVYLIGKSALANGDYPVASLAFEQLVERDPESIHLRRHAYRAATALRDMQRAASHAKFCESRNKPLCLER